MSNPNLMKNMFEKMSNLNNLTVELSKIYLNGNEWEEIIINYLPNLKIFQFKMIFEFSYDVNKEKQINEILDTFRSAFWIKKHQWFVRCRWNPSDNTKLVTLYTLPYAFNNFHYSNVYCCKSTCFNEEDYRFYNNVRSISESKIIKLYSTESVKFFDAYFPNIRHFSIPMSINNNFFHCFPSLNMLITLEVSLRKDFVDGDQLQALLDQAIHLYSLKIISLEKFDPILFRLTSKSIHRLDLTKSSLDEMDYFNDEDCNKLINSSLGIQCEVLLICIENRTNILHFIEKMSNLRLLIIGCSDDKKFRQNSSSTTDEFVEWLQNHFLSTYLIIRNQGYPHYVQIWINRQNQISNSNILITKDQHKTSRLLKSKFPIFFRKSSASKQNTLQ